MSVLLGPLGPDGGNLSETQQERRRAWRIEIYEPIIAAGMMCQWCNGELSYPLIYHRGPSGTISFHPECAKDFAARLLADHLLRWTEGRT